MKIFNNKWFYLLLLTLSLTSGLSLLVFKFYYWEMIDDLQYFPWLGLWSYVLIPFSIISILSICIIYYNKNKLILSSIPFFICLTSMVTAFYEPYAVHKIDIYNAFYEDGHDPRHIKHEIIKKLKQGEYAALDDYLLSVHNIIDQYPNKESYLNDAYNAFAKNYDVSLEKKFNDWVDNRHSFQSYTARAFYLNSLGWKIRGQRFMSDIPDSDRLSMNELFEKSRNDLIKSLKINHRNVSAYMKLIATYGVLGDKKKAHQVLMSALDVYPHAYYVRDIYMHFHLYPQWGGSLEEMFEFAMKARPDAIYNPRLIALISNFYEFKASQTNDVDKSIELYLKALEYAPLNSTYLSLAYIYSDKGDSDKEYEQYENIIKKTPYKSIALASRLPKLTMEGNIEQAINDSNLILEINDSPWSVLRAAYVFNKTNNDIKAIEAYSNVIQSSNQYASFASQKLMQLYVKRGEVKKALDVALTLENIQPNNTIGWLYAADFMYDLGMKESVFHINQYYALIEAGKIEKDIHKESAIKLRKDIQRKFGNNI